MKHDFQAMRTFARDLLPGDFQKIPVVEIIALLEAYDLRFLQIENISRASAERNDRLYQRVVELEAQIAAAHDYAKRNPLGGPAAIFDSCADAIRAGDAIEQAMAVYGLSFAPATIASGQEPVAWLPMETAPKNGTIVRLLVQFTDHSFEDSPLPNTTIGANTSDNTLETEDWQFAGWCWTHDRFTQGAGVSLGWLPLHGNAQEPPTLELAPDPSSTSKQGDLCPLEVAIDSYLEDYEMMVETEDGADGFCAPDESIKAFIKDAFMGFEWPTHPAHQPLSDEQAKAIAGEIFQMSQLDHAVKFHRRLLDVYGIKENP